MSKNGQFAASLQIRMKMGKKLEKLKDESLKRKKISRNVVVLIVKVVD